MNYGKDSVTAKKKMIESSSTRWGRRFLILLARTFLVCLLGIGIIGFCGGIGVFKGIIDSAPTINLEDATHHQPGGCHPQQIFFLYL